MSESASGRLLLFGWPAIVGLVILTTAQHGPSHAHGLVGQRNGGDILATPLTQALQPAAEVIGFVLGLLDHGARTLDQQGADIGVATFADAEQPVFATAAVLADVAQYGQQRWWRSSRRRHVVVAVCG